MQCEYEVHIKFLRDSHLEKHTKDTILGHIQNINKQYEELIVTKLGNMYKKEVQKLDVFAVVPLVGTWIEIKLC